MEVLKRFRDSDGRIVGYFCVDSGKEFMVSAKKIKQFKGQLSNAEVLKNGLVRAKAGCHIETVVQALGKVDKPKSYTRKVGSGSLKGVDSDILSDCRVIREFARIGKVALDKSVHKKNTNNLHLFEFIRNCGWDVREFILGYLSCLQPYELKPFAYRSGIPTGHVWLLNFGYCYSMVIKLRQDNSLGNGLLISFHESIKAGAWQSGKVGNLVGKDCPVIVDDVKRVWNNYDVLFTVQYGFIRRKLQATVSRYVDGIAFVNYDVIGKEFTKVMNDYIQEMYALYVSGKDNVVNSLAGNINMKDLTFTAYGFNTLNNICLMIDLSRVMSDTMDKRIIYTLLDKVIEEVPVNLVLDYQAAIKKKYVSGDASYAYEFVDWALKGRYNLLSLDEKQKMKAIRDTWLD